MDRSPFNTLAKLYRFGEVIAGSDEERMVVQEVLSLLEPSCDCVRLEPVPVLSWKERSCFVEVAGTRIRCSAHPPTASCDVEARTSVVNVEDVFRRKGDFEDRIVVVYGVEDPDDVAEATAILGSLGARAAVFVDEREAFRRIVVCSEPLPCYKSVDKKAVPAVHLPKSALRVLKNAEKVRIVVESSIRKSSSYNVLGDIYGSNDSLIYLSAHHDHWFWGCIDDLVGVSIVIEVARKISELKLRKSVRVAIYGAEEGLPENLTPFYWAVGSRYHLLNSWKEIGDRVEMVLNIDVPYGDPVVAATGLEAIGLAKYLDLSVDSYELIYDSFPFASLGIPTMTIENFEAVLNDGIYHSDLDDLDKVDPRTVSKSVDMMMRILRVVNTFDIERFAGLGIVEVGKQLIYRGAIQSIAIKGVERCLNAIEPDRNVLRVINSAIFGYVVDKRFLTKPGVREIGGAAPWGPDTIEVPTGMNISGWRKAYEKALSVLNTLKYVCRGS